VIRFINLLSGERFPILSLNDNGIPDTYALRYALVALRSPGQSPYSIKLHLYGVALGLTFLREQKIDLVERLASGLFLSRDELSAFSERCRLHHNKKKTVVGSYAAARYAAFIGFVEWRLEPILFRASREKQPELRDGLKRFQKIAKAQKPKPNGGAAPNERLGLTE
jgi:hypothetical protein